MNYAALAVRAICWCGFAAVCGYIVRNPTPTAGELPAEVPGWLLLTAPSGLALLALVRTWRGSLIASTLFVVAGLSLVLWIEHESQRSSTAGVGIIALPVITLLPVVVVCIVEYSARSQAGVSRPPQLPPPPTADR